MSALPDIDAVEAALLAKSDDLRVALVAKVDANLTGGVLRTRSGALRASIQSDIESDATMVLATVESVGVIYAGIQEYGGRTGAHDIIATKAKALRFAGAGGTVFAKSVHHPGSTIPERSYIRSAIADLRADIEDGLKAAVLGALGTT